MTSSEGYLRAYIAWQPLYETEGAVSMSTKINCGFERPETDTCSTIPIGSEIEFELPIYI